MNTMNELLQTMQAMSAAQTQRPTKADSGEKTGGSRDSSFDTLLKDRTKSADSTTQLKPGANEQTAGAEQSEGLPDETLKEVAAAMTMLMAQAAPVQVHTQEILPEGLSAQIAAPAEIAVNQQPEAGKTFLQGSEIETISQPVEHPLTENTEVSGQSISQSAQSADASQSAQGIPVTAQSSELQNSESADQQPDAGLTRQGSDSKTPQLENAAVETTQPLFRNVESVPVKVGETPIADTTQPELDAQLSKQIGTALKDGAQQVKIQLAPESLGTLTIDLTQTQDGALQVVLHTTTEKAAALLGQHAENLGALLQNSIQTPVQVEVQRQEQNQQFQQFQQNQQHGQNQQHNHRRQNGEDFLQQLRLGLVNLNEQVS